MNIVDLPEPHGTRVIPFPQRAQPLPELDDNAAQVPRHHWPATVWAFMTPAFLLAAAAGIAGFLGVSLLQFVEVVAPNTRPAFVALAIASHIFLAGLALGLGVLGIRYTKDQIAWALGRPSFR